MLTQFIHNTIKGLLAVSLVFSLFVLEKTSYPVYTESIHAELILESTKLANYQSVFAFSIEKESFPTQSIDTALLFIQASLIKLILKSSKKISLYTISIHKESSFPIHIFSSEFPLLSLVSNHS